MKTANKQKELNLFKKYQKLDRYEGDREPLFEQAKYKGLKYPDNEIIMQEALYHYAEASSSCDYEILFEDWDSRYMGYKKDNRDYQAALMDYKQLERFVKKYCKGRKWTGI